MQSEFSIQGSYPYNRNSATRWLFSHVMRHRLIAITAVVAILSQNALNSLVQRLVGVAFDDLLQTPPDQDGLVTISLIILGVVVLRSLLDLGGSLLFGMTGELVERDTREELYLSLLGKSQTFHNRQRVGDLMARANNDVRQINMMIVPGVSLIVDSFAALIVPIIFIAFLEWQLLLAPLLFVVVFIYTLRIYMKKVQPVAGAQRQLFGQMNSTLTETVTGIEVVKSTAQEAQEEGKFVNTARQYRDMAVKQGRIDAGYLPILFVGLAMALGAAHGLYLVSHDQLTVGQLVTYLGLMSLLRFPTFISLFTFSLVQLGRASAARVLGLIAETTELDQNPTGRDEPVTGRIEFRDVTFSYEGEPVLAGVSFIAEPGETVAIVGETGSGKSSLTKLINRIYDTESGQVLIDDVDVREWDLNSLRSQISTIEQDIVLFSRPIGENIAFSLGQDATIDQIRKAAADAQADGFISEMPEAYETVIGERGVTLSGGQRQRVAIARALLTDPHILILDDSTSAIDSATEDQIQRAISVISEDRTTILITHRLSQIRWADKVLVLRHGQVVDFGTHDELLHRSQLYQRIFARYELEEPVPVISEEGDS